MHDLLSNLLNVRPLCQRQGLRRPLTRARACEGLARLASPEALKAAATCLDDSDRAVLRATASGLAKAGMRPIVDIYSTFLQRSFDQIFQEVALQGLPVTFCLDRAGLTGPDGPTRSSPTVAPTR